MRRFFNIVVCVYILLAPGSYAQTVHQQTPIASKGETVIVATSAKLNVRVKILTHEVEIGKPRDKRPDLTRSSCTYSRYLCSIVDGIDIAVSGKPITVPRSVFCDLADLNSAEIRIEQNESILTLTGGDASESYIVKIVFDTERVKRKTLSSGMTPNEPLQETTYQKVILRD
jgi:hypothetical protein